MYQKDYVLSPFIDFFFVSCFDNGKVPRSPWKWYWNLLYFLPFIFTFEQCELNSKILQCFDINDIPWKIKAVYQNLQMTQDHFMTIFLLSKYINAVGKNMARKWS